MKIDTEIRFSAGKRRQPGNRPQQPRRPPEALSWKNDRPLNVRVAFKQGFPSLVYQPGNFCCGPCLLEGCRNGQGVDHIAHGPGFNQQNPPCWRRHGSQTLLEILTFRRRAVRQAFLAGRLRARLAAHRGHHTPPGEGSLQRCWCHKPHKPPASPHRAAVPRCPH